MRCDAYQAEVERCGPVTPLTRAERAAALDAWRRVYAAALFAATGRWRRGPFDWHVFSFEYTRAVRGARAVERYRAEPVVPFVVVAEDGRCPALRVEVPTAWPDFATAGVDVLVFPADLAWTMAFTHEQDAGLGPYFCPRDGAEQGAGP